MKCYVVVVMIRVILGVIDTIKSSMQIVSNELYEPVVHFEAPPSKRVESEMDTFIRWFNDSNQKGKKPLPALTRSGIAHLYFESIHPFEDGKRPYWTCHFGKKLYRRVWVDQH